MLLNKIEFWNSIQTISSEELRRIADKNLHVGKSEMAIESLLAR